MPGGLAVVDIVASMIFAAMTGAGAATTAAVGGMMIPHMEEEGYDPGFASAIQAMGGVFGPIIPPSTLMVLYAVASGQSVGGMFLGGILPGLYLGLGTACSGYYSWRYLFRHYDSNRIFGSVLLLLYDRWPVYLPGNGYQKAGKCCGRWREKFCGNYADCCSNPGIWLGSDPCADSTDHRKDVHRKCKQWYGISVCGMPDPSGSRMLY